MQCYDKDITGKSLYFLTYWNYFKKYALNAVIVA